MSEGEFILKEGGLYWKRGEHEEHVGCNYVEIAKWWRTKLALGLGVQVDSEAYNRKIDEMFDENDAR